MHEYELVDRRYLVELECKVERLERLLALRSNDSQTSQVSNDHMQAFLGGV